MTNLIEQGIRQFEAGNILSAIKLLEKSLVIHPNNLDALIALGVAHGSIGNTKLSLKYLRNSYKLSPNDALVNFNLAKALSDSNDDIAAIKHHLISLKVDPNNPDAWLNYSISLQKIDQIKSAADACQRAMELNPNSCKVLLNMGFLEQKLGNLDSSLKYYDLALKMHPTNRQAIINKAALLYKSGQFSKTIDLLDTSTEYRDNDIDFLMLSGLSHKHIKKYECALNKFKKIIEIDSKNAEAWCNMGAVMLDLEDYNSAEEYLAQAIELKPIFPEAINNLGTIFFETDQHSDALKHYNKAIELNSEFSEAWANKGKVLYKLNEIDQAILCFDTAIKIDPLCADAWTNKGLILTAQKNYAGALNHYDKALEISQFSLEALSNKGCLFHELGQYNLALDCFKKALDLSPNFLPAIINSGTSLKEQKKYSEALAFFDRALELKPNLVEVICNKGVLFYELGAIEDAIDCFNFALSIDPNYYETSYNMAILQLSQKKFQEGWINYESRLNKPGFQLNPIQHKLEKWDGNKSINRLLILPEQGVGDVIFYSSALAALKQFKFDCYMLLDERLISLFSRSFSKVNFIDEKTVLNPNNYDAYIPIASLFGLITKTPNSDFRKTPYLKPKKELIENIDLKPDFSNKFTCALSWKSSNPKYGMDKSIPVAGLYNSLKDLNLSFINIQYQSQIKEPHNCNELNIHGLLNFDNLDAYKDIDKLTSIIDACDITITSSNLNAHIAGALNKPTFLLAPKSRGRIWYWHREEYSCWYPSIQMFFQSNDFSWDQALFELKHAVSNYLKDKLN